MAEFVEQTRQRDRGEGLFELESSRMLEINLNGGIWTKMGSMVAYTGDVKFTREGILEHGVGKLLKRTVSGEGTKLTKATGVGRIYLADEGKKVSIIHLQDETIFVNGNDILAFEESIQWDIKLMRHPIGAPPPYQEVWHHRRFRQHPFPDIDNQNPNIDNQHRLYRHRQQSTRVLHLW